MNTLPILLVLVVAATGIASAQEQAPISRTSFDIVAEMGTGWNLGNTMDAIDEKQGAVDETYWGNPRTTKATIEKIKTLGFNTLRLPVSWDNHVKGRDWVIDEAWLDRVEELARHAAVDYQMYVIINVHHNNGWGAPSVANEAQAKDILVKLWRQIAARFKAYDHRVVFETMNEPHVRVNGKEDWVGKPENYGVVNRLNAAALATIRASGGNNVRRLVMLPTYGASGKEAPLNAMVVPRDPMVALSNHAYIPWRFALNPKGTTVFQGEKDIDQLFDRLHRKFIQKGTPVVIGEWGTIDKGNLAERIRHAAYFVENARRLGMPTVLWDNGVEVAVPGSTEAMGFLNRETNAWVFPELMKSIVLPVSDAGFD